METKLHEINRLLDKLIRREDCVLGYDTTLLDDLPDILVENHQVRSVGDVRRHPDLVQLFRLIDPDDRARLNPWALASLLKEAGVDVNRFSTRGTLEDAGDDSKKYSSLTQMLQSEGDKAREAILQMQSDLGQGLETGAKYSSHVLPPAQLPFYFRRVCSIPATPMEIFMNSYFWGILIEAWKYMGWLKTTLPSLSVGPRWLTEIIFFRVVHKLERHIGLDLFSDDPNLVVAGDMHKMPFPENHFHFLFIKNTIDKSYNVRLLIDELIRVLAPGAILIADQNCAYGFTTPLTRTEIQSAENLARVFKARASVEVLICETPDIPASPNKAQKNGRLAIRVVRKSR